MEIKKLGPLAAEVSKVDLKNLTESEVSQIKTSFLEHCVLLFKDQDLLPDELKDISTIWGQPQIHPVFKGLDVYP